MNNNLIELPLPKKIKKRFVLKLAGKTYWVTAERPKSLPASEPAPTTFAIVKTKTGDKYVKENKRIGEVLWELANEDSSKLQQGTQANELILSFGELLIKCKLLAQADPIKVQNRTDFLQYQIKQQSKQTSNNLMEICDVSAGTTWSQVGLRKYTALLEGLLYWTKLSFQTRANSSDTRIIITLINTKSGVKYIGIVPNQVLSIFESIQGCSLVRNDRFIEVSATGAFTSVRCAEVNEGNVPKVASLVPYLRWENERRVPKMIVQKQQNSWATKFDATLPGRSLPNFLELTVECATESILSMTFSGHCIHDGGYIYMTFLVDGEALESREYGQFHLYPCQPVQHQPVNFTQYTRVAQGSHTITVGLKAQNNFQVQLAGSAAEIMVVPIGQ